MKADELMIGDWVSYKGKMSCKITAICKNTAVVDNDTAQDWRIDYDKLTPIPLTAEILAKNGFEIQRHTDLGGGVFGSLNTYWLGSEIGTFRIHKYELDDKFQFGLAKLKYVHELQHVLKLCGIDKEIEI